MRALAIFGMVVVCFLLVGSGCATATTGNQDLTQDNVSKIQKGVTTRSQVVALLGEPDETHLLGDGRRTMFYQGGQMKVDFGQRVVQGIPIVGPILPTTDTQRNRRESLQVIVDANDVVQEYEFSDKTSETKTTESILFGGHVEQTTTSNIPAK